MAKEREEANKFRRKSTMADIYQEDAGENTEKEKRRRKVDKRGVNLTSNIFLAEKEEGR